MIFVGLGGVVLAGIWFYLKINSELSPSFLEDVQDSDPELIEIYETRIRPQWDMINGLRLKVMKRIRNWIPWTVFFLCVTVYLISLFSDNGLLIILLLVACFLVGYVVPYFFIIRYWNDYTIHFKENVMGSVVRLIDDTISYQPDKNVPKAEFEKSGLFLETISDYIGDDLFSGHVGGTDFSFSELQAYDSDDTVFFFGLFFCVYFPKSFKGATYALTHDANISFGGLGGGRVNRRPIGIQYIQLNNLAFEKEFKVYSSDPAKASAMLTPEFMARCVAFKREVGFPVQFSFVEAAMYGSIHFELELFEPELFVDPAGYEFVKELYDTIKLIRQFVEELDRNTQIWSGD